MERTTARCSAWAASFGRCWQNCIPDTAVSMAVKGPLVSAPGLGSNVSMWLGPPLSHNRMQALARCRRIAGEQPLDGRREGEPESSDDAGREKIATRGPLP